MAHPRTVRGWGKGNIVQRPDTRMLLALLTTMVAVPMLVIVWLLPLHLALPMFSLIALASAGGAALLAWRSRARRDMEGITLWDIAGAFAFLGFAAGMLSDPMNVAALFSDPPMAP